MAVTTERGLVDARGPSRGGGRCRTVLLALLTGLGTVYPIVDRPHRDANHRGFVEGASGLAVRWAKIAAPAIPTPGDSEAYGVRRAPSP